MLKCLSYENKQMSHNLGICLGIANYYGLPQFEVTSRPDNVAGILRERGLVIMRNELD